MPRLASLPPVLAVALLATALPASAKNSANLATQQAMRSITLQNWSSSKVTQAHVQTTDGRTWNLSQGGVSPNAGAEVIVPAGDCIANVKVELQGGRSLQLVGIHSCHDTEIVVRNNQITIPQQAIPGAKQHATPG